jgi:hypothetical protein
MPGNWTEDGGRGEWRELVDCWEFEQKEAKVEKEKA